MEWQITYFNDRLQKDIMSWAPGFTAHYLRLARLMTQYGPDLGMPHTRAMGQGLFEIRLRGAEGIGRVFYCTKVGKQIIMLHCFTRKLRKHLTKNLKLLTGDLRRFEMLSHKDMEKKLLSNPVIRAEFDRLEDEYAIIEALLRARIKAGFSQAQVAQKMGTKAPAVCRIESPDNKHSPSIRTLQKYAAAIGCKLQIRLLANSARVK